MLDWLKERFAVGAGKVRTADGKVFDAQAVQDMCSQLAALDRSQAVIEFTPTGQILTANRNFLDTVGYSLDEIRGQHHRMFVDDTEARSPAYQAFWDKLGRGEYHSGMYRRIAKGGREIWIQASYNPVFNETGELVKVVKYASDVTMAQELSADHAARVKALNRSLAMIEFTLDGHILHANDNFLNAMGYRLEEIVGQHHRMFVDPAYGASEEYREFWRRLGRGDPDAGRYKRFAKGGREVWIQASYNPVLSASGRPVKLVKYAQDVTQEVVANRTLEEVVTEIRALVRGASDGDLVTRVDVSQRTGDLRSLCEGVNELVDGMARMVSDIRGASEAISTAAREISSGNQDLSTRTEAQASSLEETASSMEELTSTVRQNAENAKQANQLVVGASSVAVRGGEVVRQVVDTMGEISASSKKIADIISVIDGIAFQTNILALNAAVEAARAGEQGRGFAVVATEVRSLAQRSANAAKEIKELISDSVGKVESGGRLVDEAGKTMDEIVMSVKRVTDIMSEIAAASVEQSSGIEQVNLAVTSMDEVTQQNAALVEEAAAGAESLEEQAQTLSKAVSIFKVSDSGSSGTSSVGWDGRAERRGPDRAKNVSRLPAKPVRKAGPVADKRSGEPTRARGKMAAGGGEGEWAEF